MPRWPVATLLLTLLPSVLGAQATTPASTATLYEHDQVDVAPQIRDTTGCVAAANENVPRHSGGGPAQGRITFSFIVAADGAIEPGSLTVVSATDAQFVEAGRRVLLDARCRLEPARKAERPVRVRTKRTLSWQRR